MRFLLVDHYDSYTYNVLHLMNDAGIEDVTVTRPHEMSLYQALTFDHFILSPGPGRPDEYPWTMHMIRMLSPNQCLFGICLGMQAIYMARGGILTPLNRVRHGLSVGLMYDREHPLFESFEQTGVGLYHSWIPGMDELPDSLSVIARDEEGHPMALADRYLPQWGVQFHPESILTPGGGNMMRAFHRLCKGQINPEGKKKH